MSEHRRGVVFGAAAYLLWGLFPLYFPLLEPAGAFEILAHRMIWSLVVVGLVVVGLGRIRRVVGLGRDRRTLGFLTLAAVTITLNWGMYIWGVNNGRVVECSLGYFINPLVTMLMGVVFLGERLRRMQWVAVGIAVVAVLVLALDYGRPPWLALILAVAFGTYGLAKKKAAAPALESLTVETAVITPFALAYVIGLGVAGRGHFTSDGTGHALLLMTAGLVTVVPLLCFGVAATRIPMALIGLLQYVTPTLQFLLGVFYRHEAMPAGRWAGFLLVWVALAVFTYEALAHRRLSMLAERPLRCRASTTRSA